MYRFLTVYNYVRLLLVYLYANTLIGKVLLGICLHT